MSLELKGYDRYQLEWMIEHGYSLEDLMKKIAEIINEELTIDMNAHIFIDEAFDILKNETGFKESEIWACEDEWEQNEAYSLSSFLRDFSDNLYIRKIEGGYQVVDRYHINEEDFDFGVFYTFSDINKIEPTYLIPDIYVEGYIDFLFNDDFENNYGMSKEKITLIEKALNYSSFENLADICKAFGENKAYEDLRVICEIFKGNEHLYLDTDDIVAAKYKVIDNENEVLGYAEDKFITKKIAESKKKLFPDSEISIVELQDLSSEDINYVSYDIGFLDDNKREDEVEFDIPAESKEVEVISELMELFKDFCKENNIKNPEISYIEKV